MKIIFKKGHNSGWFIEVDGKTNTKRFSSKDCLIFIQCIKETDNVIKIQGIQPNSFMKEDVRIAISSFIFTTSMALDFFTNWNKVTSSNKKINIVPKFVLED